MHKPVLLREVLEIFNSKSGQTYIDATVNGGGHAQAIAERIGEEGKVLGIDWDCELIQKLKIESEKLKVNNLYLVCRNYANIQSIAIQYGFENIDGIIFDLGFSSYHIEKSGRGFSFLRDEPLDMRYNPEDSLLTAAEIVNHWSGADIERILREYGEERYANRIAVDIIKTRRRKKIMRTVELVEVIRSSLPKKYHWGRIHPATRIFQALRVAVNDEFKNLERGLTDSISLLGHEGKIIVISFHSLEDRLVKRIFKEKIAQDYGIILTPKPIRPSRIEIHQNPRARSARLRALEKV